MKKMLWPYSFRLGDADRALLTRVAAIHERSESDLWRYLLRQEARRLGILADDTAPPAPPVAVPADDDGALTWE